ncbi:flagellar basal body P-ring formation chaperone FlgA [Acidovorax sp. PRC11]|uniref:flagellar basal body P-ring formation chaperone FlgA n=1 Tax=Acidovorax sp. PRC11 TaxID=2962592 RepID=UPI0028824A0F|nr:flagellar basal body P-ring formation chaperone FlgA [Acidovorax sp. PRC11]MDT0138594.1 flagellar basal body P-ring formation chaperone FlgA [Acidovorax sp. PRC11]
MAWAGHAWALPLVGQDGGIAQPVLRVALRPEVQVDRADVRLGDIALLSSPDIDTLRRAMAVPLGQAPRLGEPVALEGARLRGWLRSRMGLRDEQIQWEGVESTSVRAAMREIAGETVAAQAREALKSHLEAIARQKGLVQPRIELQAVGVPPMLQVPAAGIQLRIRPLEALVPGPRMLVWVDVFAGERHVRAIPVRFEMSLFAMAAVAREELAAGSEVPEENVAWREVDLARLPAAAVPAAWGTQMDAGAPLHVRKRMAAGEVLTADRVGPALAVARGQWVRVTATSGGLSLESRAQSLQDGQIGQTVRVRPQNAAEALMAKIIAPGQLELQP